MSKPIVISAVVIVLLLSVFLLLTYRLPSHKNDSILALNNTNTSNRKKIVARKRSSLTSPVTAESKKLKGRDLKEYFRTIYKVESYELYEIFVKCGIDIDQETFQHLLNKYTRGGSLSRYYTNIFVENILKAWAAKKPHEAYEWLIESELLRSKFISGVFLGIGETDTELALSLIERVPQSFWKKAAIEELKRELVYNLSFDEAVQAIRKEDKEKAFDQNSFYGLSRELVNANPKKALQWASENLSENAYLFFWRSVGPELISKIPELTLKELNKYEYHDKKHLVERMIAAAVKNNPETAYELLDQIKSPVLWDRYPSIHVALRELAMNNEQRAMSWLDGLDERYTDIARRYLSLELTLNDYERGMEFAESHFQGEDLEELKLGIAYEMASYYPEKSTTLVKNFMENNEVSFHSIKQTIDIIGENLIVRKPEETVKWYRDLPFYSYDNYEVALLHCLKRWHSLFPKESIQWVQNSNLEESTINNFLIKVKADGN